MRFLGILFIWMKVFHISKNELIYKKVIVKYSFLFYVLKVLYPFWLFIGLFSLNYIYLILSIIGVIRYFIYPLIGLKAYRYYELFEAIISSLLMIKLLF